MIVAVCEKCAKVYSEKFENCPHCEHGKDTQKGYFILAAFALSAMVGCVYWAKQASHEPPEKAAATWCQVFISQRLNDPASAEFTPASLRIPATKNADGSYSALLELRANNAFGAKIKAQYWCTLMPGPKEDQSWRAISIVQVN